MSAQIVLVTKRTPQVLYVAPLTVSCELENTAVADTATGFSTGIPDCHYKDVVHVKCAPHGARSASHFMPAHRSSLTW